MGFRLVSFNLVCRWFLMLAFKKATFPFLDECLHPFESHRKPGIETGLPRPCDGIKNTPPTEFMLHVLPDPR